VNRRENIFTQQEKSDSAKVAAILLPAVHMFLYGQQNAFHSVCKNPVLVTYINWKCSKIF